MTGKRDFPIHIHISKSAIPGAITGFSIFAGYIAIVQGLEGEYTAAAWFILLACLLDLCDGRVARAIHATSEFGIQFDSLADVINYGIAPSLLFYKLYFQEWGFAGIALGFLPVVCAAIRLARFNVESDDKPTVVFKGLPTTAAAVFLASYVVFIHAIYGHFGAPISAALLVTLAALLMVSPVRYEKNTFISPRWLLKDRRAVPVVVVFASVVLFPSIAFFLWALLYVSFGLGRGLLMIVKETPDA